MDIDVLCSVDRLIIETIDCAACFYNFSVNFIASFYAFLWLLIYSFS